MVCWKWLLFHGYAIVTYVGRIWEPERLTGSKRRPQQYAALPATSLIISAAMFYLEKIFSHFSSRIEPQQTTAGIDNSF